MKCGIKCPHFKIKLINWNHKGVMCMKYNLPLFEARIKCYKEGGVFRKKTVRGIKKEKPILGKNWPGSYRGYGPITMKLDWDL